MAVTYLDASALVKILLREPDVGLARTTWISSSLRTTSALTIVEVRSALAAAVRSGRLDQGLLPERRAELQHRWRQVAPVAPDDRVLGLAARFADTTGLRALDAMHLATAAALGDPETLFVTWDRRLAVAAHALGMAVAPAHVLG